MDKIIKHCKENPGALFCVFPFKHDGFIMGLKIENPFFNQEKSAQSKKESSERLFGPQKNTKSNINAKELLEVYNDLISSEAICCPNCMALWSSGCCGETEYVHAYEVKGIPGRIPEDQLELAIDYVQKRSKR